MIDWLTLPVAAEQRDKAVDSNERVHSQLFWTHNDVPDRSSHAKTLLELKLDAATHISDFASR